MKRIFFLLAVLLAGVFFSVPVAEAFSVVASVSGTPHIITSYGSGGDTVRIATISSLQTQFLPDTQVSSINALIGTDETCKTFAGDSYFNLNFTLDGVTHQALSNTSISQLPTDGTVKSVTFTFSEPVSPYGHTITDFGTYDFLYIGGEYGCVGHLLMDYANVSLWGSQSQSLSGTSVFFPNPPYDPNIFSTTDFSNWQACVTVKKEANISNINIGVQYATSTEEYYDYLADSKPRISTNSGDLENYCVTFPKTLDLTAGTWYATARAYDQSDTLFAQSERIQFTILSGSKALLAGDNNTAALQVDCPDTDFTIFSVDYGKGLCKVSNMLFTPSPASMNLFGGLWATISKKPPFGWFSVTKQQLDSINTSTPATVTLPDVSALGSFKDTLDYGLAFLVGFSCIMWVWHRVRKLDF